MLRRGVRRLAAYAGRDPHKVLGVAATATADDIKRAHRVLAMKHHPDNPRGGDKARFQEIQSAFDALKENQFQQLPQFMDAHPDAASAQYGGGFASASPSHGMASPHNYVHTDTKVQAMLRLAMVWCLGFAALRMVLTVMVFPPSQRRAAGTNGGAPPFAPPLRPHGDVLGPHGGAPKVAEAAVVLPSDPPVSPRNASSLTATYAGDSLASRDPLARM